MNWRRLVGIVAGCLGLAVAAVAVVRQAPRTAAARPAPPALVWLSDFTAAQARARAEHKRLLVHFTGSDWSGWCLRWRRDVFAKPVFTQYAREKLVLLAVDFPRQERASGRQPGSVELARRYQVSTIPTLLLLETNGVVLHRMTYDEAGAQTLVRELQQAGGELPVEPQTPLRKRAKPQRAAPTRHRPARGGAR